MNDTPTETPVPAPNPGHENLVNLAGSLFERHGGGAQQGQVPPPGGTPGLANGATLDAGAIARAFTGAFKALDSVLCRKLGFTAHAVTGDKGFAENIVAETRLTREEAEQIGNLSAIVASKYSLAMQFAPELALGFIMIGYGARFQFAISRLSEISRQGQPSAAPAAEQGAA